MYVQMTNYRIGRCYGEFEVLSFLNRNVLSLVNIIKKRKIQFCF